MMAPMVKNARIDDVNTLVVFVREHHVDLSSSKRV